MVSPSACSLIEPSWSVQARDQRKQSDASQTISYLKDTIGAPLRDLKLRITFGKCFPFGLWNYDVDLATALRIISRLQYPERS